MNLLLEHKASPNATTNQGQTALSIAQRLGYISVVETLKVVTETVVTTTTTTITEEKYKVVAPETMQETFMSDSEDEGGIHSLQFCFYSLLFIYFIEGLFLKYVDFEPHVLIKNFLFFIIVF